MHTVWKGSISFGLVNIPIKMFTATEEKDVRFRQLHKECNTPIRYAKMCPHCDREVDASEIVRGFEYEKGNFVIVTDEDLEGITPETRKAIEILDFVQLTEIDPIFFVKSYYLSPQDTGDKAYALLRAAMERTGKIAVARITIRNRQSLAVVRIYGPCIVLETIFYPDEVRAVAQVPALPAADFPLAENELAMAEELINSMSAPFEPAKYTDEYREDLHNLIAKKLEGEEIAVAPAAPKANVIDLMQALKASLAAASGEGAAEPAAIPPSPTPAVKSPPSAEKEKEKKTEKQTGVTTTKKLRRKKTESS
ncbi:Ku protein [Brevibacillus massiliensis]|jgi:DNA end-binding protein Ku|uniref:non-homologous end joining protein Ku n=1 Tax=Brevibacillus massiliensis TaxID=1118054 RepID=UPI0002E47389|nr:Ku protein [Brevibacillus massiliensis]